MLLSRFWVDYPILRDALSDAPTITITWEQSDFTEDGAHQMLLWVDGEDFEAFDAGLDDDPTVSHPMRVVEFNDRRLYQLELTPTGDRQSVYSTVIEEGSVLQEVTATHKGWQFRAAFPTEAALERFHSFFLEHDIDIEIQRLYETRQNSIDTQYGLTTHQRETLAAAADEGYLDIPRACSLAELADEFDISANAASERFRRGTKTLIENTLAADIDQME